MIAIRFVGLILLATVASAQIDPIENYLSSAERKANNVVENAGAQGRGIAMEAGQAALNAIASFRAAYADSLTLTENALGRQQEIAFRKIKTNIDALDEKLSNTTDNLQRITDTFSEAVSNLPGGKDIPRVTKIGPLYSVEGAGPTQELVVHGLALSNNQPTLTIDGRSVRPNTATDTELRFPFPQHAAAGDHPMLVPATLQLFERRTVYLVMSNYVPRTYPVRLAVYPRQVGIVTITPRRRVPTAASQSQSTGNYRCESPNGEGNATVPVAVTATSGWTIVISTIKFNANYTNNGSATINTSSGAGFTATLTCSGFGKTVFDAGSKGVIQGSFSYTETKSDTGLQNGDPMTRPIQWGESFAISTLPTDTETVIVELRPFTGVPLAVDADGNNQFLHVSFNSASKVATIAARGIEEALRQR
jgi:hypothetical protein